MKKILAILLLAVVTGCATSVPVAVKFPDVPDQLKEPSENLTQLDTSKKIQLSDIVENANENAGKYYKLKEKYEAWRQWYDAQKKIFDSVK
jgi:hypothetical protein